MNFSICAVLYLALFVDFQPLGGPFPECGCGIPAEGPPFSGVGSAGERFFV